jgi:U4/U6.U5 tri-snRNP-associated protein 1
MNKGYLDKEVNKSAPIPKKTGLEATNYTIEEKFYDHEERRGRDRYAGSVQEFKDKEGYKPDVKLDYVDDHGRLMTQKEAFRVLSHKFHGKGPGKNKIDKRQQKLEQESKLRQMSSIDTPLNTVQKLQEKQKELQLPYVVISGTATSLIKK